MKHTIAVNDTGAACVYAADVDNDGDFDVLGASSGKDKIAWWESDLIGVEEGDRSMISEGLLFPTIITGHIELPNDINCKLYDISGREINNTNIKSGVYFLEIDGEATQKIIKVR
jgi:hypothetical protein